MAIRKLEILSNTQVSQRYWHMVVDSSTIKESIKPGSFFNIRCGEGLYPFLRRPFSIYRINKKEQTIEFLYLVKGVGTERLTQVQQGDFLDVFGPLGEGFTLEKEWKTILLLARGVGIATLAALAQQAADQNIKCIAILSARSRNDLLAAETLQGFGAQVYKVTEEEGTSNVEHVHDLIKQILVNNKVDSAFTCGSKRLSILMQTVTEEYQLPAQIALEEHMGCAMGVCYACVCDLKDKEGVIRSVRVCKEGPVFDLNEVVLV